MRIILLDLLRAQKNIWFYITVIATIASLWLELGPDSYWVLHGGAMMDPLDLLVKALSGSGSALSLPLLASLPYSANTFLELSSGAARMAIFRSGRNTYVISKLLSTIFATALSQSLGVLLFAGLLMILSPSTAASFPVHMVFARLLSAMVFSLIGGIGALISKDMVSAIAVPTAMSFALFMLSSRFFIGIKFVDPLYWLSGETDGIVVLYIFLSTMVVLYAAVLRKEMRHYV